jgi:hypothetical protein
VRNKPNWDPVRIGAKYSAAKKLGEIRGNMSTEKQSQSEGVSSWKCQVLSRRSRWSELHTSNSAGGRLYKQTQLDERGRSSYRSAAPNEANSTGRVCPSLRALRVSVGKIRAKQSQWVPGQETVKCRLENGLRENRGNDACAKQSQLAAGSPAGRTCGARRAKQSQFASGERGRPSPRPGP